VYEHERKLARVMERHEETIAEYERLGIAGLNRACAVFSISWASQKRTSRLPPTPSAVGNAS
jgi:hypothetical protein